MSVHFKAWLRGSEPRQYLNDDEVNQLGLKYWEIGADNWKSEGKLEKICKERGYVIYGEKSNAKDSLTHYEAKHLHDDDELLFFLNGTALCDVRDTQERWITVEVNKGILYYFAAGIYHRLFLQSDCDRVSIRAKEKDPDDMGLKYDVRNEKTDDMPCRKQYIELLKAGKFP